MLIEFTISHFLTLTKTLLMPCPRSCDFLANVYIKIQSHKPCLQPAVNSPSLRHLSLTGLELSWSCCKGLTHLQLGSVTCSSVSQILPAIALDFCTALKYDDFGQVLSVLASHRGTKGLKSKNSTVYSRKVFDNLLRYVTKLQFDQESFL
jgi:hypothetical protein